MEAKKLFITELEVRKSSAPLFSNSSDSPSIITTHAIGEEGGDFTTMAIGEECGFTYDG
ncbi:hypothetical protein [Paenibacillus sp. J2TS4]|uniref:hypothetical protein n=1 Tax=Paenibacillus sp. J2TS4 TaxID=2807194 RepID=UPI001B162ED9|nr:hypothetical protein [Paenibacillus sp. J2TS4]GIP33309.1 hypothetical protein J2TS4_25190 [Paenibacillus sp. J2TS4]